MTPRRPALTPRTRPGPRLGPCVAPCVAMALAAGAAAQPGYTWTDLPGLSPAGVALPRITDLTLADLDGGGPLPTELIAVGPVRVGPGGTPQWVVKRTGSSWQAVTPAPPGLGSTGFNVRATNFGGRLRLHGVAFPGGAIATYGAAGWAVTGTGESIYTNIAAQRPSGILYSNSTGPLRFFDGFSIVQNIPAPNWFAFTGGANSTTAGTVDIFGQLFAIGGVSDGFGIQRPSVLFYTGTGANPWIAIGSTPVDENIGEPVTLESSQGDLYLATREDFINSSAGFLYVRRNSAPNVWTRVATFFRNGTSNGPDGINDLSVVVTGGTTWLVIGGTFDTVVPSIAGATLSNVGGAVLFDGTTFIRMGPTGFGGDVQAITTTDFRTLYLAGQTADAAANPIVRAWTPPPPPTCYPNCDGSTTFPQLNAIDFSCFLNRYRSGLTLSASAQVTDYANCDGSSIFPSINAQDFSCFLNRYRAGCN